MRQTVVAYLAVAGTILAAWQAAAEFFPAFLLPGVPAVARRLTTLLGTREFAEALTVSFYRIGVGFAIAVFLGTSLGLASGLSSWLRSYLRALVSVLQSVPPITWVPLLVILTGFGDAPIIIVVALASFYPLVHSVMSAAEHVDALHLKVARILGASRWQALRTVYLPEVFPAAVTGTQIAFGNAWRALVASEMVAGVGVGLGWSITFAAEIADMAGVLAHIVVIGVIAAMVDRVVLEWIKHWLLRWRYVGDD